MADINNPVDLSDYADIIANNPHNDGTNWNLGCYNALKNHVRKHYSILQNDVCCYCKINLRHDGYGEPIEHIVPKVIRPQWMFSPKNLVLSCYTCNTKKNADNTLTATGNECIDYPSLTNAFLIYHPHFDNWNDHIKEFHQYFLLPISKKGRETFKVCDLYRLNLPLDKAKQKSLEEEKFRTRIIGKVLLDKAASAKLIKQCKRICKEIIRRAQRKKTYSEINARLQAHVNRLSKNQCINYRWKKSLPFQHRCHKGFVMLQIFRTSNIDQHVSTFLSNPLANGFLILYPAPFYLFGKYFRLSYYHFREIFFLRNKKV